MRYEEDIKLDFNNTMTIFMEEIEKESVILEFGPASGRLTRYLKEECKCKNYIVEIDEETGNIASQYAEGALIGAEEGNIENMIWVERFADIKFDYILFADVLEHLWNPLQVLINAKKLLKDTGYMLISLPNIAHNSVIIDLYKNCFKYRDTGLLDSTHVKFWTYESIEKLFKDSGLMVDIRCATYTQVGLNEFDNSYADCSKQMEFELKTRQLSEVYQFVYKVSEKASCRNINKITEKADYYYTQWIDEIDGKLDLENAERKLLAFNDMHCIERHRIPLKATRIRFDPINKSNCCIEVNHIVGVNEKNERTHLTYETNASYALDNTFYFDNQDSQIIVILNGEKYEYVEINYNFISVNDDRYDIFFKNISQEMENSKIIVEQKENYICEQKEKLKELINEHIKEIEKTIDEHKQVLEENNNVYKESVAEYKKVVGHLHEIIEQQDSMLLHRGNIIKDTTGKQHLKQAAKKLKKKIMDKYSIKKKILKVGVLNPYLPTLGGGEKHMGYMCQFIERYYNYKVEIEIIVFDYNDIDVFAEDYTTIQDVNKQFGLELKRTKIRKLNLKPPTIAVETIEQQRYVEDISAEYNIFINFMFQSKHIGKAKTNIYQCMFPPKRMEPLVREYRNYLEMEKHHDEKFIDSYNLFISNSEYTNHWTEARWQVGNKQCIIYPPVFAEKDLEGKYKEDKKKNIIISVGRFFVGSHSKKQLEMVKFFIGHPEVFRNYEYHLAGVVATYQEDVDYLNEIKNLASKVNNVFIHANCKFEKLMELYSEAKIFWHATGYGINENEEPEKMEHFGITPVEAMSYGVVPVVINKGGPRETVIDGEIGYCWDTEEECIRKTKKVIDDDNLRKEMAKRAAEMAKEYSIEKFYERHRRVFNELQI